jgi:hypothetical protein
MRLREWVWSAEEAKAASALLTPDGPRVHPGARPLSV